LLTLNTTDNILIDSMDLARSDKPDDL